MYTVYNHLYNTLVLPIIEYSSFIWGLKSFDHISKIQNNLMRSFLGVGRNAPIAALSGEMGWLPIAVLTKISCIRFWLRLSKMSQTRLNYAISAESCTLAENGKNKYFELKKLVGRRAPLNSNYLLTASLCMFNSLDCWVCSTAAGLKDTSRYHG